MIIKKWNATGTAWENQAPATTASQIFTDNAFNNSVFDGNNKLKISHLPDQVFDGLRFTGTIGGNDAGTFATALYSSYTSTSSGKSFIGNYYVASNTFTLNNQTTSVAGYGSGADSVFWKWTFKTADPNETWGGQNPTSSGTLEIGDWIVIESVSGVGTSGNPYVVTFGVVNNTYEVATDTVHGIVKLGSSTLNTATAAALGGTNGRTYLTQNNSSGQLVVNVPWVNTVYSHPTQTAIDVNATDNGVNVIDRVQVNTAGHVTAVSTRNLSNATTSAAGVMSAADKEKLDGVATGATADSVATSTTLGLVELFSDTEQTVASNAVSATTGRTYGIQLNADDQAVVNVPWVNTTYGAAGTAISGIVRLGVAAAAATVQSATTTAGRFYPVGATASGNLYVNVPWVDTDTNTTYSAGNGISLSGTTFSVAGGIGLAQEASGLKMDFPIIIQTATPAAGYQVNNNLWFDIN